MQLAVGHPFLAALGSYFEGEALLVEGELSPHGELSTEAAKALSSQAIDTLILPDLAQSPAEREMSQKKLGESLGRQVGRQIRVVLVGYTFLDESLQTILAIGALFKKTPEAVRLTQKIKAQLLDLASNFYERCKGKRTIALIYDNGQFLRCGGWINELFKTCGAQAETKGNELLIATRWDDLLRLNPDSLIVFTPGKVPTPPSAKLSEQEREALEPEQKIGPIFKAISALPQWDQLSCVRRGDVTFAFLGEGFYPGAAMLDMTTVLISAVAGLESGYITARNRFVRLRYAELHRDKI